ncbi:hypothetical protein DTX80_11790 [Bacilli bacterium]|nr:hypothetical protein WH51_13340 [Bacilli bacterium VT-13-104]PZD84856.1 hypothetical protein DEJ64_10995 [Bacilli bacterium]PZD86373.1 hypothetical protein DEJ60_10810 [Bacilli bacterium]PZD89837.1 hypothetical protein DEJ66_11050 [Bacilli bacterium]RCO05347.1 hypothetical protein DTX80_11790 [Bacilli bacterium]
MKNRFVTIFIQTIANIFALWFVFISQNTWFVSVLVQLNITNQKAQLGILAALAILLSNIIIILSEWLFFEVIFKPVDLMVSFRNGRGGNHIKQITLEYNENSMMNVQKTYTIHTTISGGNMVTNKIVSFLKSDLVLIYRPNLYDTDVVHGWISEDNLTEDMVFKDKKGNVRVNWSESINGASRIDDNLIITNEFTVKPKSLDGLKCQLEIKLGSHSKRNFLFRIIFKMIYLKLVNIKVNKLTLNLKRMNK